MAKTIVFVTNQYSCDRIICTSRNVADETGTELHALEVMDSEYDLNPEAVDYLFELSKKNKATMRIVFSDNKLDVLRDAIKQYDVQNIVTGMPSSNQSVLYDLWKEFPNKNFYTVDTTGELIEVASNSFVSA